MLSAICAIYSINRKEGSAKRFQFQKGFVQLKRLRSTVLGDATGTALSRNQNIVYFRQEGETFSRQNATKDEIIKAGENVLVTLYNGKPGEGINKLRLRLFCEKVSTSNTSMQPHTIPPTSAAAQYHSQRVYLHVQDWKSTNKLLNPEGWGWTINDGKLVPIHTNLAPAPQVLKEIIRCHCKTDNCSELYYSQQSAAVVGRTTYIVLLGVENSGVYV